MKYFRMLLWSIGSIIVVCYVIMFVGSLTKVIDTEDGRIKIVSVLYPMIEKVYLDGNEVDTIDVCYGFSTYAGSYKPIKGRLIAVRDTNQITTIIDGLGKVHLKGRSLELNDYCTKHGSVTIFSYIDSNGQWKRHDFYGRNPDKSYSPHIRDDNDKYDYNL